LPSGATTLACQAQSERKLHLPRSPTNQEIVKTSTAGRISEIVQSSTQHNKKKKKLSKPGSQSKNKNTERHLESKSLANIITS
jgi:hypothetical protein